jgi:RNA polymerase sigma factor (sigma-70 family)
MPNYKKERASQSIPNNSKTSEPSVTDDDQSELDFEQIGQELLAAVFDQGGSSKVLTADSPSEFESYQFNFDDDESEDELNVDSWLIDEENVLESDSQNDFYAEKESDSFEQKDTKVSTADLETQLLSAIFEPTSVDVEPNEARRASVAEFPHPPLDTYHMWRRQLSSLQPVYVTKRGKYRAKTLSKEEEFTIFQNLGRVKSRIADLLDRLPRQIVATMKRGARNQSEDQFLRLIINSNKELKKIYFLVENLAWPAERACHLKDVWSEIDKLVVEYQDIRNGILHHNLRLVFSFVSRHFFWVRDVMELVQEGYIGLIKAIDRFDINKGYRLSTYAMWWIRQSAQRASENLDRPVHLPLYFIEKRNKYLKIIDHLTSELSQIIGYEPSMSEIVGEIIKASSTDIDSSDIDLITRCLYEKKEDSYESESDARWQETIDTEELPGNWSIAEQFFKIVFPSYLRRNNFNTLDSVVELAKRRESYDEIKDYLSEEERNLLEFYLSPQDLKFVSTDELQVWQWILGIRESISSPDARPYLGEAISQILVSPLAPMIMDEIQQSTEVMFDMGSVLESETLFELLIVLANLPTLIMHSTFSVHSLSRESLPDVTISALPQNKESSRPEDELLIGSDKESLERVLNTLTGREKLVIQLRYGLNDGTEHTLAGIGRSLGISRERVRQIESEAITKLQHPKRANILKEICGFGLNTQTGIGRRLGIKKQRNLKPEESIRKEPYQFLPLLGKSISLNAWQRLAESPTSEINWSVRTNNVLNELGYSRLSEVAVRSAKEWLSTKNFGKTSLAEVENRITQFLNRH